VTLKCGSLKVIQNGTIRKLGCGFLFAFHSNFSSINMPLTESSIYNRFCIESSPQMGFGGNFGGRGKDIWWESPTNATTADLRVFRHLWSRSDAPCSSLFLYGYFAIGENLGKFGGPQVIKTTHWLQKTQSSSAPSAQAVHNKQSS